MRTIFPVFLTHCANADGGTVNNSPWQPLRYGSSFATRFAVRRAISPRIQAPSQDRTGIFPSSRFLLPIFSPTGQVLSVFEISRVKLLFDSFIFPSSQTRYPLFQESSRDGFSFSPSCLSSWLSSQGNRPVPCSTHSSSQESHDSSDHIRSLQILLCRPSCLSLQHPSQASFSLFTVVVHGLSLKSLLRSRLNCGNLAGTSSSRYVLSP